AGNKEFITKLGDNIDFVTNVTNNQEFIDNIINKLEGTYGNVGYDSVKKELYYFDKDGNKVTVEWSDLDTTNSSFTLEGDFLTITDSKGNSVTLAVEQIASNSTFVTNLAGNKEFITKLGDNIDFITHVTENKDFIENIINQLTGTYGNVGFNPTTGDFYYLNEQGDKVEINFQEIVTSAETLTSLNGSNDQGNALLKYLDEKGDVSNIDLVDLLAKSDVFQEFLTTIVSGAAVDETITTLDKKDKGVYTYTSEDNTITNIDIIADVNTNFGDIINNEEVKNLLNQYFKDNVPAGVVTYVKEGDNYVFKYINEKGEAVEIDLAGDLINNQEFIDNIIKKLGGLYGNVVYNTQDKKFYYIDAQGDQQAIDWSDLDTTNTTFTLEGDFLSVTDSKGNSVKLAVEQIASNSTFVTNLAGNKEFITQLGDNIDFVTNVTNNQEFIDNIINKLEGTYGNVGYDSTTKELYYFDKDGNKVTVDWSDLDTTNSSFTLQGDLLTITDSKGNSVTLPVEEIASNSTFVTNLAGNKEFVTKLGDNIDFVTNVTNNQEFIDNIINKLEGTYGNVGYDSTTKELYYFDKDGNKVTVDWSDLDTTNSSFTLQGDLLTITDSKGNSVTLPVEQIASNSTFVTNLAGNEEFVTNLVENKEFITQLGDNIEFITQVTENKDF
ncbi:hypothetical protein ACYSNM_13770, partial [Myroides sp. LJL116]